MLTNTSPARRRAVLATGCGLMLAVTAACSSAGSATAPSTPPAQTGSASTEGGTVDEATSGPPTHESVTSADSGASGEPAGASPLVRAGSTALARVDGTVISIDSERGGSRWEVDIVDSDGDGHELHISRDGGTVLTGPRAEDTDSDDRAENRRRLRAAKLDYRAAARAVLTERSGTLSELNLDDDRGRVVWEADVRQGATQYDVAVDAKSGEVTLNRRSDADED